MNRKTAVLLTPVVLVNHKPDTIQTTTDVSCAVQHTDDVHEAGELSDDYFSCEEYETLAEKLARIDRLIRATRRQALAKIHQTGPVTRSRTTDRRFEDNRYAFSA